MKKPRQSLTEIYDEHTKKPEPVAEEQVLEIEDIVCQIITDETYNLEGIKLLRYKGTKVLVVHPDFVDKYVRQNIDKEMTKAYEFTIRFLQEPDIAKKDAMECIQNMRDYYAKYELQGLNDEQIAGLKKAVDEWEAKAD